MRYQIGFSDARLTPEFVTCASAALELLNDPAQSNTPELLMKGGECMENRFVLVPGRWLQILALVVGLTGIGSVPAWAGTVNVAVTTHCVPCTFTITVNGELERAGPFNIAVYVYFKSVTTGQVVTDARVLSVGGPGPYSVTIPDIQMPVDCAHDIFEITAQANITFPGGNTIGNSFGPIFTDQCSPPEGKTLDIGPSSMEGHLQIRPGDWISGGYSFKFVSGGHGDTTVTVTSTLRLPFTCPAGGGPGGEITIFLGTHNYFVPAGNTAWQPTGDANSVLSWAGSGTAPDGCNGNIMDNSKGAIFDATISQDPDTSQLLNWRFKYRDPNAKGKGNVNCLDTTDPRRDKADVCGASWSQTVRDP
jgi:hypothetical protein